MASKSEEPKVSGEVEKFGKEIKIKINKLDCYVKDVEELIKHCDLMQVNVDSGRIDKIFDRLNDVGLGTREINIKTVHT